MLRWTQFNFDQNAYDLPPSLAYPIDILTQLLDQVIRKQGGDAVHKLIRRLIDRANTDDPAALEALWADIQGLDFEQIQWALRAVTAFFHLVNMAEQREIVRINHEREMKADADHPRPESIMDALHQLRRDGLDSAGLDKLLARLDIQPTLTAHPTEARRQSVLLKQMKISALIPRLQDATLTAAERDRLISTIYNEIMLFMATDEVRAARLSVEDEVRNGLHFCKTSIWEAVSSIYDDLQQAARIYFDGEPDLPPALRFRTWIGGDRDGNPFVTPEVTAAAFQQSRQEAIQLYLHELNDLRQDLTVSDQQVQFPNQLQASIQADAAQITLDSATIARYKHESIRMKISYMRRHLQLLAEKPDAYSPDRFLADLRLLQDCLSAVGMDEIARSGLLQRLVQQVKGFGLHLITLDVRQHSQVHEAAVGELLRLAGVIQDYDRLSENDKIRLLERELQNPRPLRPPHIPLGDTTEMVLQTFYTLQQALQHDANAVGSYIISMTHDVSDMLEALLLAKECGLWHLEGRQAHSLLDFAPLFETVDDLERGETLMEELLTHPVYRLQVAARGNFQEIMLGYSDSNKDGGYWMANWALHTGQEKLARACQRHQVDFRLFHGRGGTVGRGGGRANQAILALPPLSQNGRIRFTEQGEVITFRYALPEIAHRHLEQIVHAMLLSTAHAKSQQVTVSTEAMRLMDTIARTSMTAYRDLIQHPQFWGWYRDVTPIEHISRLPIASRPVSRKSAHEVDFDGLRAIPWNFAWTQTRYNIPGWYGIGQALQQAIAADPAHLPRLQEMYRTWPFFQAVVNNARMDMARARLPIARIYARELRTRPEIDFHDQIAAEFEAARAALTQITGEPDLIANRQIIQKLIELRNPYTDVLNLLQVELLRRWRVTSEAEREPLRQALFLSINGIAAAMQSTG